MWLTSLITAEQTQACFSGASERRMHEKVNAVLLQELGGRNLWGQRRREGEHRSGGRAKLQCARFKKGVVGLQA